MFSSFCNVFNVIVIEIYIVFSVDGGKCNQWNARDKQNQHCIEMLGPKMKLALDVHSHGSN